MLPLPRSFATNAIHIGSEPDPHTGAVVPPLSLSSTFAQKSPGVPFPAGHEYARTSNPNRIAFERAIAAAEAGTHALAFASGSATLATIFELLVPSDHVVTGDDIYGGSTRYFRRVAMPKGFEIAFVDTTDVAAVTAAFKPNTKLLWLETPTNPTLKVSDIAALAAAAHRHNPAMLVAVDNTFLSPFNQRPLELGADIVSNSVSKFIAGHDDVVMGALATRNEALFQRLKFLQNAIGSVPSPFDCFLAHRGLKTLAARMALHNSNAQRIAAFLEAHPKVARVAYPGLKSHPQHELAARQQSGFGGMITFWLKGDLKHARQFLEAIKGPFTLAESLGGVESLIEHPAIMTHSSVPAEQRAALGISDSLVRLSVGIEDVADIECDLAQALEHVHL